MSTLCSRKPRVLVTRPKHQQANFIEICTKAGIEPISLPCMDILPVSFSLEQQELDNAELVFFTSRNAVEFVHESLALPWMGKNVLTIGKATQRMLNKLNQPVSHQPIAPYTSEAFIEWYSTQSPASSVILFKGVGGRKLIEEHFLERGISLQVKEVYKRVIPVISDAARQLAFVDNAPDIISVTSDDVLRNLVNIAGPLYANQLKATPLVVNSKRCAALAARLGFDYPALVADPAGDEGQLAAVKSWVTQSKH